MQNMRNNPYLKVALEKFTEVSKKIWDMESDFNRSQIGEYEKYVKLQAEYAAELIKLGYDYEIIEDNSFALFYAGGRNYKVGIEDIVNHLTEDEMKMMFQYQYDKDKEVEREARRAAKTDVTEGEKPDNLLSTIMQYMVTSFLNDERIAERLPTLAQIPAERTLLDDINAIQKKAIELERNSDKIARERESEQQLVSELTQQNEDMQSRLTEVDKSNADLIKSLDNVTNELKESENKIKQLEAEIESSSGIVEKIESYETIIENLKNDNERLMDALNQTKEDTEAGETMLSEDKQKEFSALQERCDSYAVRVFELEEEVNKLSNQGGDFEALKEQLEKYKKMALFDSWCDVKNINAFEEEFNDFNKDHSVVIVCGICGMKRFNKVFGRKKGDEAIRRTANMIKEHFEDCDIYRLYGDQFVIVSQSDNLSIVKSKMERVQRSLSDDLIETVYGCVDGIVTSSMEDAYKQAEAELKQMQARSGSNEVFNSRMDAVERSLNLSQNEKTIYAEDDIDVLTNTEIAENGEPEINAENYDDDEIDYESMFENIISNS